ncbi:MAG TPA: M28 family metallopeptidase [Gemmatimonadaceae bacterium]|nr:M28 family metallopeptidase [Gemmatimonadaceae bacterium]
MPRYQRIPPRRPLAWRATLGVWAGAVVVAALLAALVAWSERLPAPRPARAPADTFSAARAWPALAYLADTLGHRLPGSPASARARDYLVARLRALPGVEVAVQDVVGVRATSNGPTAYRVRNVLARIPGRSRQAVLLAAHYDSPAASVGAADDAVAVAASLEVARALAAGPTLAHSVVLNLNDGEEQGLLGADGFLRHPWSRDVRAFVNLESAGNRGKAILFQVGPGNAWLARRYAASVPHPYGSVVGQDIFQSGLVPSATDFEVYTRGGDLRGVDIAFYRGGYAYHTPLDRAAAIAPGSVQHMGADALALVRALASRPLPAGDDDARSVYYDVLGTVMLAYPARVARVVAILAALALLLALPPAVRRSGVRATDVAAALAASLLAAVLAVAATVGVAAVGPYLLGRAHGWFAHPLRAALGYGGTAATVLLLGQWWLARRRGMAALDGEARWIAAWSGALLLHLALLAVGTAAGVGSSFLLAWWVLGGAFGLTLATGPGRGRRVLGALIGIVPGALLTLQTAVLLVALFVPVAGRFPTQIPFDLVLAAIVAVSTVVLLTAPVTTLQRGERLGLPTLAALGVSIVGLATIWLAFPYTPTRPQRLVVVHDGGAGTSQLVVDALDFVGPARAIAAAGLTDDAARSDGAFVYPAPPPPAPPPRITLLGERRLAGGGREVDVRLELAGAYAARLTLPVGRAARWRIEGIAADSAPASRRASFVAAPDGGWQITISLPDAAPVVLEATAYRRGPSPAAAALLQRLPRWTAPYALVVTRSTAQL